MASDDRSSDNRRPPGGPPGGPPGEPGLYLLDEVDGAAPPPRRPARPGGRRGPDVYVFDQGYAGPGADRSLDGGLPPLLRPIPGPEDDEHSPDPVDPWTAALRGPRAHGRDARAIPDPSDPFSGAADDPFAGRDAMDASFGGAWRDRPRAAPPPVVAPGPWGADADDEPLSAHPDDEPSAGGGAPPPLSPVQPRLPQELADRPLLDPDPPLLKQLDGVGAPLGAEAELLDAALRGRDSRVPKSRRLEPDAPPAAPVRDEGWRWGVGLGLAVGLAAGAALLIASQGAGGPVRRLASAPPGAAPVEAPAEPAPGGLVDVGSREERTVARDQGLLTVKTDRPAQVFLDGAPLARTPMEPIGLAAGVHKLRVVALEGRATTYEADTRVDLGHARVVDVSFSDLENGGGRRELTRAPGRSRRGRRR